MDDLVIFDAETATFKNYPRPQATSTWPSARAHHMAASVNDSTIVLFGGRGSTNDRNLRRSQAWMYDLRDGKWSAFSIPNDGAHVVTDRFAAGACYTPYSDGSIAVIGGRRDSYDDKTGTIFRVFPLVSLRCNFHVPTSRRYLFWNRETSTVGFLQQIWCCIDHATRSSISDQLSHRPTALALRVLVTERLGAW
jgi:hypothetical protein